MVDDDTHQRDLMYSLLAPIGFEVLLADKASTGFEFLQEHDVDLVLMDVRMPEINGWKMVEMLREQHYSMPVLMVSANARDAEYNLQAEGYHNDYIAKPINLDALLGKIAQLLNLQWLYEESQNTAIIDEPKILDKPLVTAEQYQSLIALAEIGYLSGFKDKFSEIESVSRYPEDIASQIKEYVEVCNFPKIIEYLSELNHEA
ncbi:response regulator [Psychromonas sp. KJ10-10]|uniref:response regulator n=1 Tax=Psychromonas sp. KJ10-10 TaxID=3391823 RepID=UPI0039B5196A